MTDLEIQQRAEKHLSDIELAMAQRYHWRLQGYLLGVAGLVAVVSLALPYFFAIAK